MSAMARREGVGASAYREALRVLIVGGRLQGVEIAFLARQAGFHTVLVDRAPRVPASGLVDRCVHADVFDEPVMSAVFAQVDIVFPAIEDACVLERLIAYGRASGTPVVGDPRAYAISSSKRRSNELFDQVGICHPEAYPGCEFPVIVKPDGSSGSRGVARAFSAREVEACTAGRQDECVVQRYVEGRVLSMEVIGDGHTSTLLPITEVCIAPDYDAERIIAPASITDEERRQFMWIGRKLADRLSIDGIFDIEAVAEAGRLSVLEIDARFPSQTPVSICYATGVNMVERLASLHLHREAHIASREHGTRVCWYQQVEVGCEGYELIGEHPISSCGPLHAMPGMFGADVMLSDRTFREVAGGGVDAPWQAIVIVTGASNREAHARFESCMEEAIRFMRMQQVQGAGFERRNAHVML